ncbi:MAG: hypothetical protein ABL888_02140 [Pirellulaceae bacterium]
MENNKSPERLIIYLIAAIWVVLFFHCAWVYLFFYCAMTALRPIQFFDRSAVGVTVHVAMNIFIVYATFSTTTWQRRIFISGILGVTLAASSILFFIFPPNLFRLTNAMLNDALQMLNILNWTSLFAIVLFVLGSFLQWQFGPLGVRAQKLSIKTLMFVMTAVALTVALETFLAAKLEQRELLFFAMVFLPKLFSGLCIARIATHRRWRLALPAVMLMSPLLLLVMYLLIGGRINSNGFMLRYCLPDLIGSGILIWFYIAISRRGWQLHVARNPKADDRLGTELVQSQGPVGVFPEDANA